jgi:hypothetical protein
VPYGWVRRIASRTCWATGPHGSAWMTSAKRRQSGRVPRSTAARIPSNGQAWTKSSGEAVMLRMGEPSFLLGYSGLELRDLTCQCRLAGRLLPARFAARLADQPH